MRAIAAGGASRQQLQELINRKSRIGDDAPERAEAHSLVIGNRDARRRIVAAQDHVAAALAAKNKARS